MRVKKIAFVGLGRMGLPMAANLAKAGFAVAGCDAAAAARDAAIAEGLQAAEAVAADGCEALISMLPAGKEVTALYLGDDGGDGLLAALPAGFLIVDCSTTDADCAKRIGAAAAARGIDFIDAPVSGGVTGARAGALSFMVGGESAAIERARPLLAAMGANIMPAGGVGAGQTAKICNNMLLSVLMAGTCEALALGAACGIAPATLSEIMRKSSGGNWALEKYNPWPGVMPAAPAARDYEGGFIVNLMAKDSDLAMAAARQAQSPTPLGALANQLYRLHRQNGHGERDFSGILSLFTNRHKDDA